MALITDSGKDTIVTEMEVPFSEAASWTPARRDMLARLFPSDFPSCLSR